MQWKNTMQETCNKKIPERNAIYYIYDHSDHQVLSQDGEQRARGEWIFSLSDELDRPVLTGICHDFYYYEDFPFCETDVNDSYGGSTPCYNGNVSSMSWKAAGDTGVHGYRFSYDGMSRLTGAGYLWNRAPGTNYNLLHV